MISTYTPCSNRRPDHSSIASGAIEWIEKRDTHMTIKRVRLAEPTIAGRKKKYDDYTKDENDLNYRQKRFIAEYSTSLNGTAAAIKAGYAKSSARTKAAQLLAKSNIKAAVAKAQARTLKRCDITAD